MATIAAPIISGVTSILGGLLGGSAAKRAAQQQAANAYEAANNIVNAATNVNTGVSAAEGNANTLVQNAATTAQNQVQDQTNAGVGRTLAAVQAGNAYLNPYETMGGTASNQLLGMLSSGTLGQPFNASMMEANDPGYQFRIDQGEKALSRDAAASGQGVQGGATQTALENYAQNAASSEYNTAFQQYEQGQQQQYAQLAGLSGMGQQAAALESSNTMQGNEYASQFGLQGTATANQFGTQGAQWAGNNAMQSNEWQGQNEMNAQQTWGNDVIGAGNALASGIMGQANAYSSGLQGVGNAFQQYNALQALSQIYGPQGGGYEPGSGGPITPVNPNNYLSNGGGSLQFQSPYGTIAAPPVPGTYAPSIPSYPLGLLGGYGG